MRQRSLQFLMQRVDEFVGATRQSDDITCLVLRLSFVITASIDSVRASA